jgi:MFS family permease
MVDVGTCVGGIFIGYLGDRFSHRALFLSPSFFISSILMFIVSFAKIHSSWLYYLAMLLIGVLAGGPYNIIGTAITIDIGD